MMNRVLLIGRLTDDPQKRVTNESGIAVCNFSLAVERDYITQATGKRETDFIDITAWRGLADFAANFLHKGIKIAVDGRLETSTRTSKEGVKYRNVAVIAENIYFCEAKREENTEQTDQLPEAYDGESDGEAEA